MRYIRCTSKTGRIRPIMNFSPTPCGATTPTGAMWVYPEGHHGNAVLSRFPIEYYENRDISVGNGEKRGLLYCRIVPPQSG